MTFDDDDDNGMEPSRRLLASWPLLSFSKFRNKQFLDSILPDARQVELVISELRPFMSMHSFNGNKVESFEERLGFHRT